jgi:hypothetical protein
MKLENIKHRGEKQRNTQIELNDYIIRGEKGRKPINNKNGGINMEETKQQVTEIDKYGKVGLAQIKRLISDIIQVANWPSFDFVNGVLSSEKVLGNIQLWYWFGNVLIASASDRKHGRKAGEMQQLDFWVIDSETKTIQVYGKKQEE